MYRVSKKIQTQPRHQSIITLHTSRYLHSDSAAVIYRAQQRHNQKADTSKNCQEFFSHPSSFHFCLSNTSPLPNPNYTSSTEQISMSPLGIPFSFSGGPRFSLSLTLSSSSGESATSSEHAGVANCIIQMGVRDRSAPRIVQKAEALAWLCPAVPHHTPACSYLGLILCPLRTWDSLEVSSLFARHLALHRGWDIFYKSLCHLDSD